jgi:hypothetical protein
MRLKPVTRLRYAVHPGIVYSLSGDRHFLSFHQLVNFYGVDVLACVDASRPRQCLGLDLSVLVHLHPRADGQYTKITDEDEAVQDLQGVPVQLLEPVRPTRVGLLVPKLWEALVQNCEDSAAYNGTVQG